MADRMRDLLRPLPMSDAREPWWRRIFKPAPPPRPLRPVVRQDEDLIVELASGPLCALAGWELKHRSRLPGEAYMSFDDSCDAFYLCVHWPGAELLPYDSTSVDGTIELDEAGSVLRFVADMRSTE
ncbi:MAG: hypothetical protein ACAI25_09680 [Planctomycetota bacterium]